MPKNRRESAFTLVELLVVVSIISVLAAILLPVFAAAREQARAAVCLSNSRQISAAILLYTSDYDDVLVPWRTTDENALLVAQISGCWVTTLGTYLKSRGILFCPSFDETRAAHAIDLETCDGTGAPGSGSGGYVPAATYLSHYGIAIPVTFGDCSASYPYARFPGSGWADAYYPGLNNSGVSEFIAGSLAAIVEPARTAMVGDGVTVVRTDAPAVGMLFGCEGRLRHKSAGTNLSFADSHAKYLTSDPESYFDRDERDGCMFERYFTADR